MNNKSIVDDGKDTQFSSTNQPPKAGRKPNMLKKFIKEYDVSKQDVETIIKNLTWNYSAKQLKALYKSLGNNTASEIPPELQPFVNKHGELPAGITVIISGIMHDVQRGDMKVTNSLLDRVYGKAAEKIEHNGGLQLFTVTKEEQEAL